MRPKIELFCPVTPFDRDVSQMSPEDLRAYAATLPNETHPPVRWPGDGLDATPAPDGPPPADDFAGFFEPMAPGQWHDLGNRTVVDLAALVAAFERRCREARGSDPQHWPALVLTHCHIKRANLEGLTVGIGLRLIGCVFLERARLTFARLGRGVDLLGTIFAEAADFTGTVFAERAHFAAAAFLRGVRFHEARFEADVRFNETAFNGPVSFEHARFSETIDLSLALFRGATWVDLHGLRVGGRTALAGDLRIRLEQIEGRLLGEHGGRLSGDDGQPAPTRREQRDALQYAADQYSMLAGNFAASTGPGSWRAADLCHSRYLDLRRKTAWLAGNHWEWIKDFLFKVCLGNGIWLKYPLELALMVILGFALLYAVALSHDVRADRNILAIIGDPAAQPCGAVQAGAGEHTADQVCLCDVRPAHARVATALYYSAITFTTVGYGDWHPVGWARLFASLEALGGITIMSAFTVILVRKIIR